MLDTDLF
jgi:hypothetical protein